MYYGLFFSSHTKSFILKKFGYLIPEGWKVYADHVTLIHSSNKDFDKISALLSAFVEDDTEVAVPIIGYGISENAIALKVDLPSFNKVTHITLAVRPGHTPVESNEIKEWYSFPNGITCVFGNPKIEK